jgi:hypothetical protein
VSNRLKIYFDAENQKTSDLSKIVEILNDKLAPHVTAKMVGNEAVIRAKNKAVWINTHCLVSGQSSTPYSN